MQLRARLAEAIQLHTPKFDRKGQIPLPVVIGKGCVMVQGINRNSGGSDEETGARGCGNRTIVNFCILDAAPQSGQFGGAADIGCKRQDRL